jgi:hypothetical protein
VSTGFASITKMNQMLKEINHNGANCFWPLHQHSTLQTSTISRLVRYKFQHSILWVKN